MTNTGRIGGACCTQSCKISTDSHFKPASIGEEDGGRQRVIYKMLLMYSRVLLPTRWPQLSDHRIGWRCKTGNHLEPDPARFNERTDARTRAQIIQFRARN